MYVWPNNICTTYYLFIYKRTQRWKLKIKFHFENVFRWKERNIHFTLMQARTSIEIHKYSEKSKQAELSPSLCREPYCHWRTPFLLQLDLDIPVCVFSLSFSLKIKCKRWTSVYDRSTNWQYFSNWQQCLSNISFAIRTLAHTLLPLFYTYTHTLQWASINVYCFSGWPCEVDFQFPHLNLTFMKCLSMNMSIYIWSHTASQCVQLLEMR